jgi:hypothetical protein
MSKPQKRCTFCGATGMSKEHIWGDWLKKHVATAMPKHGSSVHVLNPPGEMDDEPGGCSTPDGPIG